MKHIFVDFEMQPLDKKYKAEREICKAEIIEIGAIAWDDSFNEISSYKRYVKPAFSNHISRNITELTGINDGTVFYSSKSIADELNDFAAWCLDFKDEFKVHAWSENDLNQILREYQIKNLTLSDKLKKVVDNWHDLQLDYDKAVGAEKSTSLSKALESLGIYFDGKMHDALDDARNTATIFKEMSDPEEFQKSIAYINELKNTTSRSSGTTLGDLIDFSKFKFDDNVG